MAAPSPAPAPNSPPASLAGHDGVSGLELMQRMMGAAVPGAPMVRLLNGGGGSAGPGWVEFTATPGAEHYNPIGSVHGGYAATLLDSCMGCAVHTSLGPGIGYTTVDLNITYLRAMTVATGVVTARGEVIASGRRIATARGTLVDGQGRTIATGTTTCLVFPLETSK